MFSWNKKEQLSRLESCSAFAFTRAVYRQALTLGYSCTRSSAMPSGCSSAGMGT